MPNASKLNGIVPNGFMLDMKKNEFRTYLAQ